MSKITIITTKHISICTFTNTLYKVYLYGCAYQYNRAKIIYNELLNNIQSNGIKYTGYTNDLLLIHGNKAFN